MMKCVELTQMLRNLMFQTIMVEFMTTGEYKEWLHQQVTRTNRTHLLPVNDYRSISECL